MTIHSLNHRFATGGEATIAQAQHNLHWQHFYAGASDALEGCLDAPSTLPAGSTHCGGFWDNDVTPTQVARPLSH